MKTGTALLTLLITGILLVSCAKSGNQSSIAGSNNGNTVKLSYRDSVYYITTQNNYIVSPDEQQTGKYFSFPDGLSLNENTGAINVSKSDAGLKYRVSFAASGKTDTVSTFILISGINYIDGFYNLSTADSILKPVYNANKSLGIPGINNGTTFDVGSNCNSQGCKVNTVNAEINLAQTVRNGVFGTTPSNNDRHEFVMTYRINDNSAKFDNQINVKLYFFKTMNDVTQEAFDIIASRQGTIIGPTNLTTASLASRPAKPRPPCIFIVGH